MSAKIIDGRALAEQVGGGLAAEIEAFSAANGFRPGLAVVLIGDDPASLVYVRSKLRRSESVGIDATLHHLPATTDQATALAKLQELNADPGIHGILLQWPVPAGLDYAELIAAVDPRKDVDGFHPLNSGRLFEGRPQFVPCTPLGIMRLLDEHGYAVAGRHAVVVGRSPIVGRPMAALLLTRDATVTVCHSRTTDLAKHTREADVLIVAAGKPGLIGAAHVRPGAVVIDVGINRLPDGKLTGDVDFDAVLPVAAAITPVPGGVGPMTVAMLLHNTLEAARWSLNAS